MATENNNKTLNVPNKREQSQTCLGYAERKEQSPQGNVPNLRFPEFSREWDRYKLEEFATISKERIGVDMLSSKNYISTENMRSNFGGVGEATNLPASGNVMKFQQGDTLLSNIRPYLKKIWKAEFSGGCSTDIFVFRSNTLCNQDFLYYTLANEKFISYAMSGAKGVKMPRGDKEQMLKYELHLPTTTEQDKITSLLSLLDERIATQIKIIEKLESLIKGLCQKLTQQDNPNTALNDTLVCYSSTLQESSVQEAGGYPVYGATGVCGYTDTPEVDGDSILIIKDGASVGVTYYASGKYSAIGTLNRLVAKRGYSLRYLYYCLKVFNFAPYRTGLAIPHIYFRDYGKAKVWCPSLDEQQRIADALSKVEQKIAIEKSLLEQLYSQKRFLLQAMFI